MPYSNNTYSYNASDGVGLTVFLSDTNGNEIYDSVVVEFAGLYVVTLDWDKHWQTLQDTQDYYSQNFSSMSLSKSEMFGVTYTLDASIDLIERDIDNDGHYENCSYSVHSELSYDTSRGVLVKLFTSTTTTAKDGRTEIIRESLELCSFFTENIFLIGIGVSVGILFIVLIILKRRS